jgi:hypothetical protein
LSGKLIFNSPWYAVLLLILASAAVSYWLYRRTANKTDSPRWAIRLLIILRFTGLFLTSLLLLEILLKHARSETEDPLLLVAIDDSRSIVSGPDSAAARRVLVNGIRGLSAELGEKYKVTAIHFGTDAKANNGDPTFAQKETDIDNLFKTIDNNYSNLNIGAVILASDGIYNRGANPLYASASLSYPVYAIAAGDTTERKDAAVRRVDHNQLAYLGNAFPVEVSIGAKKLAGGVLKVDILRGKEIVTSQQVAIRSVNFTAALQFTLQAAAPGVARYEVRVSATEGESNLLNNRQSFAIEVIDNKDKVLCVAHAPHPDIRAIREVIEEAGNYEFSFRFNASEAGGVRQYGLVIVHGYGPEHHALLGECRNAGIPYWIIAPRHAENLPGIRVTGHSGRHADAEPLLKSTFGLFTISGRLAEFVGSLPAVKCPMGNYAVANGFQALITQRLGAVETDLPLLVFNESEGLRSAVFVGDGLWRWRMRDYSEHDNHDLFLELVSKTVQFLVVKSDRSYFRITAPRIVNENDPVEMQAEVYNKNYELITSSDVVLTLTNADNKTFRYTFSKTARDYRLNLGALAAGEYRFEARCEVNGEAHVRKGSFMVQEILSEQINTVANHQLLYQLASRTGGGFYFPSQIGTLANDILKDEKLKPITYTTMATNPLIELAWLFPLILVIFAVEWFLRKRYFTI